MLVAVEAVMHVYAQSLIPQWTQTVTVCVCLQEMSVGYANGIRVMSMTHTGEPGFMLYIPIEVGAAHTRPYLNTVLHEDWIGER